MIYNRSAPHGRLPFDGPLGVVLAKKQYAVAPRPSTLVREIPPDLDDLHVELLEHDPSNRPTGAQLLHRLEVAEPRGGARD